METSKKLLASVIGLVAVVGGALLFKTSQQETGDASPSPTPSTSPTVVPTNMPTRLPTATPATSPTATPTSQKYKNGTYTTIGNYTSPAGAEELRVTLTLSDDTITAAEVVSLGTHPTTIQMQAKFISGYKAFVIGKKIDEVVLTKVSGSSLSPKGFNDAVAEIKLQAKS